MAACLYFATVTARRIAHIALTSIVTLPKRITQAIESSDENLTVIH